MTVPRRKPGSRALHSQRLTALLGPGLRRGTASVASLAALTLSACGGPSDLPPPKPEPTLDAAEYFTGRSQGTATLHTITGDETPVRVQSFGRRDERGRLILDQRIREGDKDPRTRRWVLRQVAPNRWTGTLTPDAAGPVTVTNHGNAGTIRYTMKNGMAVEQQLRLQPDERTLRNLLTVDKWGVPVAWLEETIRKSD